MKMLHRVVSGSAAVWTRMAVVLIGQIVLVPIFLKHWSPSEYGEWLVIQSLTAMWLLFDSAHQAYIEGCAMKLKLGAPEECEKLLINGVVGGLLIGVFQLALLGLVFYTDLLSVVMPSQVQGEGIGANAIAFCIFVNLALTMLAVSPAGVYGRILAANGHFARFAWWGALYYFLMLLVSACVLFMNGGIIELTLANAGVTVIYQVFWYCDAVLIMRVKVSLKHVSLVKVYSNITKSIAVFFRISMDFFRQMGIRILISGRYGTNQVAEFATLRTVSNVAMQSLGSIYGPILPEISRLLNANNKRKVAFIIHAFWVGVVFVLFPALIVMQYLVPSLYPIWTAKAFVFNSELFASMLMCISAYGFSLPAIMLVHGRNLLKYQVLGGIASILIILGVYFFIPSNGSLLPIAFSIYAAEVCIACIYCYAAAKYLGASDWPLALSCLCFVCLILFDAIVYLNALPGGDWVEVKLLLLVAYIVFILFIAISTFNKFGNELKALVRRRGGV